MTACFLAKIYHEKAGTMVIFSELPQNRRREIARTICGYIEDLGLKVSEFEERDEESFQEEKLECCEYLLLS